MKINATNIILRADGSSSGIHVVTSSASRRIRIGQMYWAPHISVTESGVRPTGNLSNFWFAIQLLTSLRFL